MALMKISVVIPNFNGQALLRNNLPQVAKAMEHKTNNIQEVILVDDASTDGSVDYLTQNFLQIKLIKLTRNRGFSVAVNTGVRKAKGDLVCLLNTDVSPDISFLAGVGDIFGKDSKLFGISLHEAGFGPAKGFFRDGFFVHSGKKEAACLQKTFWVNGGSGVFVKKIWDELGGFDEKLFTPFYWEDVDLSYRAAKRGYKLLWAPDLKVIHKHEGTTGKINPRLRLRVQERNQLLFIWKNITSPKLTKEHLVGLFGKLIRNPGYLMPFAMALGKLVVVLEKRKIENKQAVVADEVLLKDQ
jgi:GT2 family glycosyltransferase